MVKGRNKHIRIAGFLLALILLGMFLYGYGYTDTVKADFTNMGSSSNNNSPSSSSNTQEPIVLTFKGYFGVQTLDTSGKPITFNKRDMYSEQSFSIIRADRVVGGFKFIVHGTIEGGKPPYTYTIMVYFLPADNVEPQALVQYGLGGAGSSSNYKPITKTSYGGVNAVWNISIPSWMQAWGNGTHKALAYATLSITDSTGHTTVAFKSDAIILQFKVGAPPEEDTSTPIPGGGRIGLPWIHPESIEVIPIG